MLIHEKRSGEELPEINLHKYMFQKQIIKLNEVRLELQNEIDKLE